MDQINEIAAIASRIGEFKAAYDSSDLDGLLAIYSDDLIKLRMAGPPETKPEIARRLAETFKNFNTTIEVVNDEIVVSGDLAYARGSFDVTLQPRIGGDSISVRRRFLEIWRKFEGTWFVTRTMDNA